MIGSSESNVDSTKLSTLSFQVVLIVMVVSALFLVQSQTSAYAQDCELVPGNPITNCGFETGNFAGWVTQDLSDPFFALQVGGAGLNPGEGLFSSDPTQGNFAALTGFDGDGPGTIRIAQDVLIPFGAEDLVFDYRCGWNLQTFGATEDRTFSVNIEESGGGAVLQSDLILTALPNTQAIPDNGGNMTGIVDVTAFAGQSARISFDWFVPQTFTGPAFCQLDNVSIGGGIVVADVPTLSEWGLILMAGILGIVGFMIMRRRKLAV